MRRPQYSIVIITISGYCNYAQFTCTVHVLDNNSEREYMYRDCIKSRRDKIGMCVFCCVKFVGWKLLFLESNQLTEVLKGCGFMHI